MPVARALFPVFCLAAALTAGHVLPAAAQGLDMACDASAREFANAHAGGGRDMMSSILEGAMNGTVAGGAWAGPSGAERGAHAGAAWRTRHHGAEPAHLAGALRQRPTAPA
ncbi:hypothetical protein V6L77_20120 [Pannonibacter sp. Pt2-lr]